MSTEAALRFVVEIDEIDDESCSALMHAYGVSTLTFGPFPSAAEANAWASDRVRAGSWTTSPIYDPSGPTSGRYE